MATRKKKASKKVAVRKTASSTRATPSKSKSVASRKAAPKTASSRAKSTKQSTKATTTRRQAVKTVVDVAAAQTAVLMAAITCLGLGISPAKFTSLSNAAYKQAVKRQKAEAKQAGVITGDVNQPQQAQPTQQAAEEPTGTRTRCYKVLAQRGKGKDAVLTSIYARNGLRVTYSDQHFVNAPHPSLPITAFGRRRDAERFIQRNTRHARSPWILVEGEGVQSYNGPSRKLHSLKTVDLPQVDRVLSTLARGRRRDGTTNKWARGTIFLNNFKILQPLSK